MTTHFITVTSQKGGVAKTTSALAIAHGLARANHPTLLVDFDPQGHAAISLGMDPEPGIFDFFVTRSPEGNLVRETGRNNLAILPSNSRTRTAESVLRIEATLGQLVERMQAELGGGAKVIATGGNAGLLTDVARCIERVDENLRLDGLRMLYEEAHPPSSRR